MFGVGMETAQLVLKATELGLVAHPIAGYSPDRVKEILGIPEEMVVVTLIIVGKKSDTINELLSESQVERELNRPKRLSQEQFIAMDHFDEKLIKETSK
jgi:nitroreductase